MSASFQFSESNGAGEVVSDGISNLNMGDIDAANLNTVLYPVVAGNNSYEKYFAGKFTGVYTEISNMKFWKSLGEYKASEDIKAAANQVYAQSVKTTSVKATSTVPITEGTALALLSYEGNAIIEYGVSGVCGYTGYIVLQHQIGSGTPGGALEQKTFALQYDEV